MGPITLFDKSFLQSLSVDESVWFDKFFLTNISPLFFVETLADLEKAVKCGRTPEQEVGLIAFKTPELSSSPNVYHRDICISNLMGNPVTMDGRVVRSGGRPVRTADRSAIVFDVPPEAEALSRWQKGEFLIVERRFAKLWRKMLGSFDLEDALRWFNLLGINGQTCKTLEDAKQISESVVDAKGYSLDRLRFAFSLLNLNIPEQFFARVFQRWGYAGFPSLKEFAPYASHVLSIETFFYVAAASNLISRKKASSKVDLAYLFYLPFCMVFVSSDHIHRRCAPLFMRENQEFVWGLDLKMDLQRLDNRFSELSEAEKEKGLFSIAGYPPRDGDFLVSRLWDRFFPNWRERPERPFSRDAEKDRHILQEMKKLAEAKTLTPGEVDFDLAQADAMVVQRSIHRRKGKWWLVPKDLPDRKGQSS